MLAIASTLILAACGTAAIIATTETSKDTVCALIGDRDPDTGHWRPPRYNPKKDTPKTIAFVRYKIAQGAQFGCWPAEEVQ